MFMMTDFMFCVLVVLAFALLLLTLIYKNVVFGSLCIILFLLLGFALLPSLGGVAYVSGATITSDGDNFVVANNYSYFTNYFLSMFFLLIVMYLVLQVVFYKRSNKDFLWGGEL